jgi:hypothetical protein
MATSDAAPSPSVPSPRSSRLHTALNRRHNPLRRRTDVVRSWLRILLMAGLAAALAVSALLSLNAYQGSRAAALRDTARLRQTQALALTDASHSAGLYSAYTAEVRWTDADGGAHTAAATVPAGTVTGGHVTIWLDSAGHVSTAPAGVSDSVTGAVAEGMLVLVCLDTLLLALFGAARSLLSRSDLYRWGEAWRLVEPQWSHRR